MHVCVYYRLNYSNVLKRKNYERIQYTYIGYNQNKTEFWMAWKLWMNKKKKKTKIFSMKKYALRNGVELNWLKHTYLWGIFFMTHNM